MLPVYTCFELENQYFINCMGLVKQNIKVEINLEEFLKNKLYMIQDRPYNIIISLHHYIYL